jgi:SAM-dependent methyltransferase
MEAIRSESSNSAWNAASLRARIERADTRVRYEAGSPDRLEVAHYRHFLADHLVDSTSKRVLVLGMTPEIRRMALELGCQVTSVDNSPEAIELYADWVDPALRDQEEILQGNWLALDTILPLPVDAILGDGVFGNVITLDGHRQLLRTLKAALKPGGTIVLRQALVPRAFHVPAHEAQALVEQFRAGELSEAEFGFAMRLWGNFDVAYDKEAYTLDNRIVFERYEAWAEHGGLTQAEHEIIRRYYSGGINMILPQEIWENCLIEEGFRYRSTPLVGKAWYAYYPLYVCRGLDA